MNKIRYNMIVAYCNNYGIGYNNKLPWYFKNDMMYFKKMTIGNKNNAVIMGKNTMLSIPNNYLPYRDNYCITSNSEKLRDIYPVTNLYNTPEELENTLLKKNYDNIWIIGGQQLYQYYLQKNKVDSIYITHIHKDYITDRYLPFVEYKHNFCCIERNFEIEKNTLLEFLKYDKINL
jgi:dihydrofolate reductase